MFADGGDEFLQRFMLELGARLKRIGANAVDVHLRDGISRRRSRREDGRGGHDGRRWRKRRGSQRRYRGCGCGLRQPALDERIQPFPSAFLWVIGGLFTSARRQCQRGCWCRGRRFFRPRDWPCSTRGFFGNPNVVSYPFRPPPFAFFPFARCHSASISSSVDSCGCLPRAASAASTLRNRPTNFFVH